jgi:hypothetical protein
MAFSILGGTAAAVLSLVALGRWAELSVCPAWLLRPGLLQIGEIRRRDRSWSEPPATAVALELTVETDDEDDRSFCLLAVLDSGKSTRLSSEKPDGAFLRELGAWLAARTGLPLTDRTSGE